MLIPDASALETVELAGVATLGITAGASAPERLVQELVETLRRTFEVTVEEVQVARENLHFRLPRALGG